jgi:asparagine synthase (glutamine-hydrolysing)
MCGICGIVQFRGLPHEVASQALLDRMTDAMIHRGPDDRGTLRAPGVAIGARRLSIVDVDGGHQPFANESGDIWAVQNGELFNHVRVREELRAEGHVLRTRCDTEILPHLYEEYGVDFPIHLRGMFGIAVWDSSRYRLVLARDRLGVKPLYYSIVGDYVVFASELKSLLASGLVDSALDYDGIDAFLTLGYTPTPDTLLTSVKKLEPGACLVAGDGVVSVQHYWSYPIPRVASEPASEQEYAERLLECLDESVRLRLMSDVPLGAMLSGGLDSSLIVALMARHSSQPIKTFAVGFVEDSDGNELADARDVSRVYGTEHHELELSFNDAAIDLQELIWHLDEPIADIAAIGFIELCRLAARHVTVALTGQGADELFAGYEKHQAAALASTWRRLPIPRRASLVGLLARRPGDAGKLARALAAPDPVTRLLAMSGRLDPGLRSRLLIGPLQQDGDDAGAEAVRRTLGDVQGDPLGIQLFLDARLGLVDQMLHYFDRASMAHSLEVRVPFLDHPLVEYAATIPSSLKVRRLRRKHILKVAASGLVPEKVIQKKKIGFFKPAIGAWLDAQLAGPIQDVLLDPSAHILEFVDRTVLTSIVERTATGERSRTNLLIGLLMLELWLSTYLPRATFAQRPTAHALTA